ncbi:WxL domain-containing protein [Lacticaseibacillus sharpeae]|uniref:WxL domain-containing protein n=1 Tax=Lacticaseibacillus sharpeae JCM 1186 = DSM 20505 TaxID=1291052 RepID=A0A0R1ZY15_9LACO|nr:WxL domain-containing protein [Lacticaseibacillus sharpeae]KRM55836.1 hypothetical protein FC18_GL000886 [Lacticaseibacillus sharpeae JCM 1186 = DSM 20505]
MIKQSFLGVVAVAAAAIVLGITGNTQSAKADTTTHATVTFTLPEDSKIEITSMPNIDFGSEQVNTSGQDIQAKNIDAPLSIDNPGFATGWHVDVAASNFTTSDKSVSLAGAAIKFTNGSVKATAAGNVSTVPTVQPTTVQAGSDSQTLVNAAAGTGVGAYDTSFANTEVSLDIPSGNVAADYTSDLTWTLANTPM